MVEWVKTLVAVLTVTDWMILSGILLLGLLVFLKKTRWKVRKLDARHDIPGFGLIYADQKQKGRGTEDFGKLL